MKQAYISRSVSKLGSQIPSINLPPVITCRPDAPCFAKCYARKGRFCFAKNKAHLQDNHMLWLTDANAYERSVVCAAYFSHYFRWHSSGDIPDAAYLDMMVRVANKLPDTCFLCFTKKHELVNTYISANGELPQNLTIVLSAWGSFLPSNPYDLPVAYVRFKNDCNAFIPENARECRSYCGECISTGISCWDLRSGESVVFDEH